MKLKRIFKITKAFDKRDKNPSKNYGIGSCRIFFAVVGNKGAISVNFETNWYLPSTIKEYKEIGIHKNRLVGGKEPPKTKIDLVAESEPIKAYSWNHYSKKKKCKEQVPLENCKFMGGKVFCDSYSLTVDDYLKMLLEGGSDALFERLERDYNIEFASKTQLNQTQKIKKQKGGKK